MEAEARLETEVAQFEERKDYSAAWKNDVEKLSKEQVEQSKGIRGLCDRVFGHAMGRRQVPSTSQVRRTADLQWRAWAGCGVEGKGVRVTRSWAVLVPDVDPSA